jgi:hypothetical protein
MCVLQPSIHGGATQLNSRIVAKLVLSRCQFETARKIHDAKFGRAVSSFLKSGLVRVIGSRLMSMRGNPDCHHVARQQAADLLQKPLANSA